MDGDTYQHRTAWAGKGTGVLVLDADGNGKISRSSEYVFTEWDSSATGDLEAIKNVFDSNHNGKLDAGDDRWSQFKVMVDGSMVTLASLGITAIDLTPSGSGQTFADGSSIQGTTTFTKSDGSTGIVGDAVLVTDDDGYILKDTTTTDGAGVKTRELYAYNADGSLAFRNTITSSADGNTVTTKFDDDGNGTYDRTQTIVSAVDGTGIRTQTISNFNVDGSLSDKTTTVTSADKKTVTTTLDQDGDGIADQSQVFVTNADKSTKTTVKALNADGTVSTQVTTTGSIDGLSKSVATDRNADGVNDLLVNTTIVVGTDGSRTTTVENKASGGKLLAKTVTTLSADSRTRSETFDVDGNAAYERKEDTVTTVEADGTVNTDTSTYGGDTVLRMKVTDRTSADGLTKSTASDLNGDAVFERVTSDVTVVAADGSLTHTETVMAPSSKLLSKTVTVTSADRKTITITEDSNGDGVTNELTTIVVGTDGSTVQTDQLLAINGALISKTIDTTTADGLSKTSTADLDGNGTIDRTISDIITAGTSSSRVETVSTKSNNNTLLGKTITTTTADSLTQTVETDSDGDGLADRVSTDAIVLKTGGIREETVTLKSRNATLLQQSITTISADRQTTTVTIDADGDSKVDSTSVAQTAANGTVTTTDTYTTANGVAYKKQIATVSDDGLDRTTTLDFTGDGVTDLKTVDQTVLKTDASSVRTITNTSANATLINKTIVTTSGNGYSVTTEEDRNGDGVIDHKQVKSTSYSTTSGSVGTTTYQYLGTTIASRHFENVSVNGLSTQVRDDYDGDAVYDFTKNVTQKLNTDGTSGEYTSYVNAANATYASKNITVSADQRTTTVSDDFDGDTKTDLKQSTVIATTGIVTKTDERYNASSVVTGRVISTVTANGLVKTSKTDINADGVYETSNSDTTVLNADGSSTRTFNEYGLNTALISRTTITTSGNGLSKTTVWADGTGATVRSSTDVTVLNADGSTTETLSFLKSDGSLESKTITTDVPRALSTTVTTDINGDGVVDQKVTSLRGADGSTVQTYKDLTTSAGTLVDSRTVTTDATGLQQTTDFDNDGNGTVDKRTTVATVINANGSKTTTTSLFTSVSGTLTLKGKTVVDTSADGMTVTTKWDTTGAGTFDKSRTDVTVQNADGSRVQTVSNLVGTTLVSRFLTTTSANGASVTTQSDLTGAGTYGQTTTDVTVFNTDGTRTRTITSTLADGTILDKQVEVTSANGRIITNTEDRLNLSSRVITNTTDTLADGSSKVTVSTASTTGTLLDKVTTTTSADSRIVTVERDANGDDIIDQRTVTTAAYSGIKTSVTTDLKTDGTTLDKATSVTAANGLQTTTDWDLDGNGTSDRRRLQVDAFNADGSRTSTITDTNLATNTLSTKIITKTSADGLTQTMTRDTNGDGTVDQTDTTTIDASGASFDVVINNATAQAAANLTSGSVYWKQAIAARTETRASNDGRIKTIKSDYDGDGISETTWSSQVQNDGSVVSSITETDAAGVVKAKGTANTSADGLTTVLSKDSDNDNVVDHVETAVTKGDGSITLTSVDKTAAGAVKQTVVDEVSAAGTLVRRTTTDGTGAQSAQTWSKIIQTFDGLSRQLTEDQFYDDGTRFLLTYDPANIDTTTRMEDTYDTAGRRTTHANFYDNGERDIYYWDVTNSESWSWVLYGYDTSGRCTGSRAQYDNGEMWKTWYDYNNNQSWSSYTDYYNSGGTWYQRRTNFDNGNYDIEYPGAQVNHYYANGQEYSTGPTGPGHNRPPVLLDLDGDGHIDLRPIDLASPSASPTFDWDGDGIGDPTAWVGPSDGFLAIDLASDGTTGPDGVIDQAKELAFSLWADPAADGTPVSDLEGLRQIFDSNHDNVLSADDDRWSEFRVWRDANQNGISDAGELLTMTDAGIKLINLIPTADGSQTYADGSAITGTSTYETVDGITKYLVADATLSYQPSHAA